MRVHERVQVGVTVSCSPAQARHENKEGQEAQQPQQQQQPRPLEQGQRPLTRPSPAPGGTRGKSDQAPNPWWPDSLARSPHHDTRLLAPAPPPSLISSSVPWGRTSLALATTKVTVPFKQAEAPTVLETGMCQAWEQLQRSGGSKAGRGLKEPELKPRM